MSGLSNTLDGVPGVTVPASAGVPNAVAVSHSGPATLTWDATHWHSAGASMLVDSPPGGSIVDNARWDTLPNTPTVNAYTRCYLYLTAYPVFTAGTQVNVIRLDGAAGGAAVLSLRADGTLHIDTHTTPNVAATAEPVPLNQWVRVEFDVTGIVGATGNISARMFSGPNLETGTPDVGGTASALNQNVGGTVSSVRFLSAAAYTLTVDWKQWVDDLAYSDTAAPGPAPMPPDMRTHTVAPESRTFGVAA